MSKPKKRAPLPAPLPCPFCGKKSYVEDWHGGLPGRKAVSCPNARCHAAPIVIGKNIREAIQRWNKRAKP